MFKNKTDFFYKWTHLIKTNKIICKLQKIFLIHRIKQEYMYKYSEIQGIHLPCFSLLTLLS